MNRLKLFCSGLLVKADRFGTASRYLFLFSSLAISSCSKPVTEFPISRDILTGVLIDVYVAEAEAQMNGTSAQEARIQALAQHGIDTSDFNETMRQMTLDPEAAKEVYQAVLDSVIFDQRTLRATAMHDSAEIVH